MSHGRGQILTDQNWQFARMLALRGVLAGLAFLHERGLMHGDLKVGIELSGVEIGDCWAIRAQPENACVAVRAGELITKVLCVACRLTCTHRDGARPHSSSTFVFRLRTRRM